MSTSSEVLSKVWNYITFKKPDPDAPKQDFNIRAMHTINKISIFMFLVGMIILIYKWIT